MRTVAVTNAKGGVGKTTTAINLAAAIADLGRRVLLIDADPSGNASLGLFPTGPEPPGLADVLLDGLTIDEAARSTGYDDLDLVPPGARLGACSDQMGGSQGLGQGREFRMRRVLRGVEGYDVVLIDTSPVQTPLNVAILYAVDEVLIPIDPCVAALAGVRALEDLVRDVGEFRRELTSAGVLAITGVLITRADRTLVARQIEAEVRDYFGPGVVFERAVPASVKFREAFARGVPLVHYDRHGAGARAYRAAAEAFLDGTRSGGRAEALGPEPADDDSDDNDEAEQGGYDEPDARAAAG